MLNATRVTSPAENIVFGRLFPSYNAVMKFFSPVKHTETVCKNVKTVKCVCKSVN